MYQRFYLRNQIRHQMRHRGTMNLGRLIIKMVYILLQVPVASWFDDMTDSELLDLIPFFEKLSNVENIYTVLCNSNHPYNQIPAHAVQSNQSLPTSISMAASQPHLNPGNTASLVAQCTFRRILRGLLHVTHSLCGEGPRSAPPR